MSAKEPREARSKTGPTPRRPRPIAAVADEGEGEQQPNGMQISFEEMQASYEGQIGHLAGQILQKDLIIQKLQQALVEKSKNAPTE